MDISAMVDMYFGAQSVMLLNQDYLQITQRCATGPFWVATRYTQLTFTLPNGG